jgi:hypothetical protein
VVVVGGFTGRGEDSVAITTKTREEGGARANMRLTPVKECYLSIKSRHNFDIEYIHIF